tara:strand:+ start:85 stop:537 length:453 start_codon:yes stop_codon:yes gene_type:complete
MAAGTAASSMNGLSSGRAVGAAGQTANSAMQRALRPKQQGAKAGVNSGGAGMKQRFENLETRLDAIEGTGKDPVQSVQPIQEFVTGGSFGDASSTPPAPVATGTLNASPSPGSLQETMPSPGDPAADMFGNEFMRNASVGAAKMRINKKI